MNTDLDGKVALVSGGGWGIGRETCLALSSSGADVALTELPDRLSLAEETAQLVRGLGRRALVIPMDQTVLSQIEQAVRGTAASLGRLDILVNNASGYVQKRALDVNESDWDMVLDTALKGMFFLSQTVAKQIISQGSGGSIVSLASIQGLTAMPERGPYCAAKAGVIGITRLLAVEWAEYGINVNAVAPGYIETPPVVLKFERNPGYAREVLHRTPMGRLGKPEEVAAAIAFLASPAATYVTGHTLLVDGGWTAW